MLPTRFRVGTAAATTIELAATAAADLWQRRGGEAQSVTVDVRQAAASLLSFMFLRLDGAPFPVPQGPLPTMGIYRGADGRWIHLHGALPHLRDGTLRLLGCEDRADSIAVAVARWQVFELEDALAAAGQCGAVLRTAAEWAQHPQGQAVAAEPLVELTKIGEAPRRRFLPAERPLTGLRVLDLTRILAGPICARTLAEHGADVLHLSAPHLPDVDAFVPDTSHGKRSAFLDLRESGADARLRELLSTTDVFSQGYRSGALDARGFGVGQLAAWRPGIVQVSINAYGHHGPWAERRGWEQLAQAASGLALEHSDCAPDDERAPAVIPAAVCDYCTGHLAAAGAMQALLRQCDEGGSWQVRVSLARTAEWLRTFGMGPMGTANNAPTTAEIARWSETRATPWGELGYLGPVARMSRTPPRWERPSSPLGSHLPEWGVGGDMAVSDGRPGNQSTV